MRSSDVCNSALERQGWYQPLGGCETTVQCGLVWLQSYHLVRQPTWNWFYVVSTGLRVLIFRVCVSFVVSFFQITCRRSWTFPCCSDPWAAWSLVEVLRGDWMEGFSATMTKSIAAATLLPSCHSSLYSRPNSSTNAEEDQTDPRLRYWHNISTAGALVVKVNLSFIWTGYTWLVQRPLNT